MTDELDPEALRRLLDATAALPRTVQPERDAWPTIRDRIDERRVTPISSGAESGVQADLAPAPRAVRRFSNLRWLAAAAVLLVVGSSSITYLIMHGDPGGMPTFYLI